MKKNKAKKNTPVKMLEFKARLVTSIWVVEKQSRNGRWVPEALAELGKDYNTAAIRFGNPKRRIAMYHKLDFSKEN